MEWISVKDRVPKEECEVIIVCNAKSEISFFNGINFTEPYGGYCFDNVDYWMPLPNPPKDTQERLIEESNTKYISLKD